MADLKRLWNNYALRKAERQSGFSRSFPRLIRSFASGVILLAAPSAMQLPACGLNAAVDAYQRGRPLSGSAALLPDGGSWARGCR